jgi:DNA-binding CsgD family transcriptional regulator
MRQHAAVNSAGAGPSADARTAERLSDIIGSIYDCVLDPGNWVATLESITREFTFTNAALGVVPLYGGAHVLNKTVGFDPEWLEIGPSYAPESVALWGGAEGAQQYPLDEPIIASQIPGYADRHNNRYFRDILEPRGFHEAALIMIAREPAAVGYVTFNRHRTDGDIGEREVTGLRLLGPHFRRAVTISSLFDLKAIEAASFAAVLDGFAFGVLLVDEQLGIVHANPVANQMLADRDPLVAQGGTLALRDEPATAALLRAVRQAGLDAAGLGVRGIGIPARRAEGDPCVVHVMPLRPGPLRSSFGQRATAALFVAPATATARMPSEALALLYDLTPAETRILEMIVAGKTQSAIAIGLGIAPSTVKTHLLRLFDKTGCKRQVDLVRLAAGLTLPV